MTLGPLHQSHDGEYMCIAYMNSDESDITNETVTVDVISESLIVCASTFLSSYLMIPSSIYLH